MSNLRIGIRQMRKLDILIYFQYFYKFYYQSNTSIVTIITLFGYSLCGIILKGL